MTPARLAACLASLDWGANTLATQLALPRSTVRGWLAGRSPVPENVARWLDALAKAHERNPAPRSAQNEQR